MYVPYMPIYYLIIEYKWNDRHTHDTHVNKAKYYKYLIEKPENNLLNYPLMCTQNYNDIVYPIQVEFRWVFMRL